MSEGRPIDLVRRMHRLSAEGRRRVLTRVTGADEKKASPRAIVSSVHHAASAILPVETLGGAQEFQCVHIYCVHR